MAETIQAIETLYDGYRFRSRLEARWAVFFHEAGIPYIYEPEGYKLPDGTFYLPDFYLPWFKMYIDIKPLYEDANKYIDVKNKLVLLYAILRKENYCTALFIGDPVDMNMLVCSSYTLGKIDIVEKRVFEVDKPAAWFAASFSEGCWYTEEIDGIYSNQGDYSYSKHYITINLLPENGIWNKEIVSYCHYNDGLCLEDKQRAVYERGDLSEYRLKARRARFEHGEVGA